MNKDLIDFLVSCADRYYDENLEKYNSGRLRSDWWEAFNFFIEHACYQGRRDSVSDLVYKATREALSACFVATNRSHAFEALQATQWRELEQKLQEKIGKGRVGKGRDIRMVTSALDYIALLPDRNIINQSIDMISSGRLCEHYLQLQSSQSMTGIVQVGPKIAAVYLRNVVALFDLAHFVDSDSAFCLQPIDTWVRQLARKLDITSTGAGDAEIQRAIVKTCLEFNVPAFQFNQGMWYFGSHTLEIALELAARANSIPGISSVPSH